ncbi:MAG: hypothetical protein GKS01_14035 [Alphaproteobacteria bacterium]|nr:hypothetical protein [Alphaproteobacteria bacterium]
MLLTTVSIIMALGAVAIPCLGLWQRIKAKQGIGWQFIRFSVIGTALPICCILALNDVLSGEAATLLGTAMGYAFGHQGESRPPRKKTAESG